MYNDLGTKTNAKMPTHNSQYKNAPPQPKTPNTKVSGVSVICVLSRGFQTRFEASQNYFKSLYMGLLVYMNASNIYRITLEAE